MTRETISIRLDPEVWKKAKIQAIKEDLKMGEFVEKALKEKMKKERE